MDVLALQILNLSLVLKRHSTTYMTMASAIFSHRFWQADSLVLAPFAFGFLISNSTY